MRKQISVIIICLLCSIFTTGCSGKLEFTIGEHTYIFGCPVDYREMYDYSAADELAETELQNFIYENGYIDYDIITTERAINFGALYGPKSKINFTELKGIILVVYEVSALHINQNEPEMFNYGVVITAIKGVLEVWDFGLHIDSVDRLVLYILD